MKHWEKDAEEGGLNYKLKPSSGDRDTISVHITESWNRQDTGNVLIDFVISTECGAISESLFIPKAAFKELVKIQKTAKASRSKT